VTFHAFGDITRKRESECNGIENKNWYMVGAVVSVLESNLHEGRDFVGFNATIPI
jgi:hypothetical protein